MKLSHEMLAVARALEGVADDIRWGHVSAANLGIARTFAVQFYHNEAAFEKQAKAEASARRRAAKAAEARRVLNPATGFYEDVP